MHFGPCHPAAHGVLRILIIMATELVLRALITHGHLHRGHEKLMEARSVTQCAGLMDRLDYVAMLMNE